MPERFSQLLNKLINLFRHPYNVVVLFIGCLSLTLASYEGIEQIKHDNYNVMQLSLLLFSILSIIIFILKPIYGSWLIVIASGIGFLVSFDTIFSDVMASLFSITVLAYLSPGQGCVCALLYTAAAIASLELQRGTIFSHNGVYSFIAAIGFFFVCGLASRLRNQRDRARSHAYMLQYNATVANELHDYTCNELTDIKLMLEHLRQKEPSPSSSDSIIDDLEHITNQALHHTRNAIKQLNGASSYSENKQRLRHYNLYESINQQKNILEKLGFNCHIIITDQAYELITAKNSSLVTGLLRELFGNIAKYAKPSEGCVLTVTCNRQIIDITLCDTPKDNVVSHQASREGTGLARYRLKIESIRGTWSITQSHDIWMLHTTIPIDSIPITHIPSPA